MEAGGWNKKGICLGQYWSASAEVSSVKLQQPKGSRPGLGFFSKRLGGSSQKPCLLWFLRGLGFVRAGSRAVLAWQKLQIAALPAILHAFKSRKFCNPVIAVPEDEPYNVSLFGSTTSVSVLIFAVGIDKEALSHEHLTESLLSLQPRKYKPPLWTLVVQQTDKPT